jgi:endogenous inhibitor of DNA gyrase (YacG/DUF329 family)
MVEHADFGKFKVKDIDVGSWQKEEKIIEREVNGVYNELKHKHPGVKVWVEDR